MLGVDKPLRVMRGSMIPPVLDCFFVTRKYVDAQSNINLKSFKTKKVVFCD